VDSGRTIPAVREALVELNLGQWALKIWVIVANITDEFILGGSISYGPTTRQWTWDAVCYNWARKRRQ
jgi:hypothetical protein